MSSDRRDIATASTAFPAASAAAKAVSGRLNMYPRFSLDNARPSDHGGIGQTCSNRSRCSADISAGYSRPRAEQTGRRPNRATKKAAHLDRRERTPR